ncbi:DUF4230 domain-containing protein [Collinsella sp. AGMB00827]|uniref:DUF4230 domain-containing protein n=1 Tax=Collinsella ureilytica TaxID=2869515 RepID=A0ABS7MIM4_9ACTN|nr:DUF4230 domain-containing protein [Collinsella urealyticum]MBY4796945.1 DUF4230 domain-containing protein [Collinsella urealyticum]
MRRSKQFGIAPLLIIIVLGIALGALGVLAIQRVTTPVVRLSATTVQEQISRASELATARLSYRGLVTYEQGDLPFITKKGFTMIYDADVRAGVDLTKAEVKQDGKSISVALPAATMQSISIDPHSIQFFDEKFALFNWQNRADAAEALKIASSDAEAKVDASALIETSNDQAIVTVKSLLEPFVLAGDYTVDVKIIPSQSNTGETTKK